MTAGWNAIEWRPRSDGELPAPTREKRRGADPSDPRMLLSDVGRVR